MAKYAYIMAEGDLLEKGLGVKADPQDPRLAMRIVCHKCPEVPTLLTQVQMESFIPVVITKYPMYHWSGQKRGDSWIIRGEAE